MADPFDLLGLAAQLALGFAGFGGLVSGLRPHNESDDTRVDAGRLINMLIISLVAMGLALTPGLLALFDVPPQLLWRAAAIIAFAMMAGLAPGVLRRSRRMQKFSGFDRPTAMLNNVLAWSAVTAFALCALDLPRNQLPGLYVTGVFALLAMSAVLFFRVMLSALRPHAPD